MTAKKVKFEHMNRLLRTYMTNMQRFFTENASKLDVTPQQAHTLTYIQQHPGLIQRELGDYFHLRNATITSMLKNLERDGYIVRKADQKSARIKRIYLTEAGTAKTEAIQKSFDQAYTNIVDLLNEQDVDSLIKSIRNINDCLKK